MTRITREDINRDVKAKDVHFLRLAFTGIDGILKNVEVPISQLDKVLDNKMMFDGSSIEGFVRIEESDMFLVPDLDTWIVFPWEAVGGRRIGLLLCDIYQVDGTPFPGDPRGNLKRMVRQLEAAGFSEMNLGPEAEFFLFLRNDQEEPTLQVNDHAGYFDLAPVDLGENCRRDIVLILEELGFEVEASHHEGAIGQHEIDFKYLDVVQACDKIQLFKLIVRTIAREHNLHATFMPKPVAGIAGSGMHCNLSLFTEEGNAFAQADDDLGLSKTAYQVVGGLLKHAKALTSVGNPLINSYKRLTPGFEAPVHIAWSAQNRSPLVRVPSARGNSTRLELRSVDPSANPYLIMAGIIGAALSGIENDLTPPHSIPQNIYDMNSEELADAGIDHLPYSLNDALNALEADPVVLDALGQHIADNFIEAKRFECADYEQSVSAWEIEHYFKAF